MKFCGVKNLIKIIIIMTEEKLMLWLKNLFFHVKVFICIALLLGVSAEEKAKKEEAKPVEASKKQDKRGIFDHDFGGHDFGSSHSSFSSHDFGSHGHEIHHSEPIHEHHEHHDFHHHDHHPVHEKVVTVVKKVPVPGKIKIIKYIVKILIFFVN